MTIQNAIRPTEGLYTVLDGTVYKMVQSSCTTFVAQ